MDSSFERLIESLRKASTSKSSQGTMMERLMKQFLLVSPLYSRVYDKVWLWSDFPYNGNQHDLGIDLVAHIRGKEDDYCAVQVKFYEESHAIQKADVDTFLSASGKPFYVNIHAKKRLYMTATPRIYADASKQKAKDNSALLCSMDDESIYGPEFYRLSFSDAVSQGLLSDYKVVVLAVDEEFVSRSLQKQLTDSNNELTLDDAVKIVGCMNGLAKKTHFPGEENYFSNDPQPMRRAVAFTQTIEQSKKFVAMFEEIQALYKINTNDGRNHTVELKHVDGSFNALERKNRIEWLKQDTGEDSCRVLSNARCLSEGVDVPALDPQYSNQSLRLYCQRKVGNRMDCGAVCCHYR